MASIEVTLIERDGTERTITDAETGKSLMQVARDNDVDGILGECGGSCACATCHVYVDDDWVDRVGGKSDTEQLMLEEVFDPQPNSRLSCQIKVSEELDGLVVRLPERQV